MLINMCLTTWTFNNFYFYFKSFLKFNLKKHNFVYNAMVPICHGYQCQCTDEWGKLWQNTNFCWLRVVPSYMAHTLSFSICQRAFRVIHTIGGKNTQVAHVDFDQYPPTTPTNFQQKYYSLSKLPLWIKLINPVYLLARADNAPHSPRLGFGPRTQRSWAREYWWNRNGETTKYNLNYFFLN